MASKNDHKCQIFHENPATLQQNAAAIVAAHLWRNEIVINNTRIRSLKNIHPKLISCDNQKPYILEAIDRNIRRRRKSLNKWLDFHFISVFFPYLKAHHIVSKYSDFIHWNIDSSIDFDRTAKNFMAVEIDKMVKYKIACLYCFEDNIRSLWPDVQSDKYLDGITFLDQPLFYYWSSLMDDRYTSSVTESRASIEKKLIERGAVNTWSAMLYLWTNSVSETKLDRAIIMLERSSNLAKNLLSLFTESQLEKIIEQAGVSVMVALARSPAHVEFALQMWHFMKNTITEQDFVSIIDSIGKLNSARKHLPKLLYGIWIEAPDNLKNFAVEKYLDGIIHLFCRKDQYRLKNLARDINLLLDLLSYQDLESRNRLWREKWIFMIEGVNASNLEKLMKLCFENHEKITAFKTAYFEDYSTIEFYCEKLVEKGYLDELEQFLQFCSANPKIVAGLKKKILWSKGFVKYCLEYFDDPMKIHTFHKFASDIYPEPRLRMNFRSQVIASFWNNGYLRELIDGNNIHSVKNLVRSCLTRANDQKKMKKFFQKICFNILTEGKFDSFSGPEWDDLLMWSMNNQAQLDKFKRCITIDGVFEILFYKWLDTIERCPRLVDFCGVYDYYESESFDEDFVGESYDESKKTSQLNIIDSFNLIDDVLWWHFNCKKKIDEFKMIKIKKYRELPLSVVFLSKNHRLIRIVLGWFFEADSNRIETFMNLLKRFL